MRCISSGGTHDINIVDSFKIEEKTRLSYYIEHAKTLCRK